MPGDGRYQITAPAASSAGQEWLPLPDARARAGAFEDQVKPVPHANLTAVWRNQIAAGCRPCCDKPAA